MASLSVEQIKELLERPKNSSLIEVAKKHQLRLQMYVRPIVDREEFTSAHTDFLERVKQLLPDDKYKKFDLLFNPPLHATELVDSIYKEHQRVFDSQNPYSKFNFSRPEALSRFQEYVSEIKDREFWETKGWDTIKSKVYPFVVVDLPAEQTTDLPTPYYYIQDIFGVFDFELNSGDQVEYIITKQPEDRFLCIDSVNYSIFDKDHRLINQVPHNHKYCPAHLIQKEAPISTSLGKLDWYEFFETSKQYNDLSSPYPIYWGYEQKCNYTDGEFKCDQGLLHGINSSKVCPSCKGKGNIPVGVGTYVSVPPPASGTDADMRNPVGVLPAEVGSLEYNTSETQRLRQDIYYSCVGTGGEAMGDQAVNEKQVTALYESRHNILVEIKKRFEKGQKFVLDTIAYFQFGDSFTGSIVNWGTEFYLKSLKELNEAYKEAKNSGKPQFELALLRSQIYLAEYKNNVDMQQRLVILDNLEPWPDYKLSEVKGLGFDVLFPDDFLLKANFNSYIQRFEREQGSILSFGESIPFKTKIERIKQKLQDYVNETNNTRKASSNPGAVSTIAA